MKAKLKFILPVVLLLFGGVYKFVLAKPPAVAKPKIAGEVYVLPKDFLINLKGNHFAKLSAALVLKEGYVAIPPPTGEAAGAPPTGYGGMPQEAVIRAIVTNTITDLAPARLAKESSRRAIQKTILKTIRAQTDVKVDDILFTDVAIQ